MGLPFGLRKRGQGNGARPNNKGPLVPGGPTWKRGVVPDILDQKVCRMGRTPLDLGLSS
jgi:hypothetical protein